MMSTQSADLMSEAGPRVTGANIAIDDNLCRRHN
jgi:hypothetical protein